MQTLCVPPEEEPLLAHKPLKAAARWHHATSSPNLQPHAHPPAAPAAPAAGDGTRPPLPPPLFPTMATIATAAKPVTAFVGVPGPQPKVTSVLHPPGSPFNRLLLHPPHMHRHQGAASPGPGATPDASKAAAQDPLLVGSGGGGDGRGSSFASLPPLLLAERSVMVLHDELDEEHAYVKVRRARRGGGEGGLRVVGRGWGEGRFTPRSSSCQAQKEKKGGAPAGAAGLDLTLTVRSTPFSRKNQ